MIAIVIVLAFITFQLEQKSTAQNVLCRKTFFSCVAEK